MSFQEVLQELPTFTVGERQLLMRRSLELDEPSLPLEDEALVEARMSEHQVNPASALSLDQITSKLRNRFAA